MGLGHHHHQMLAATDSFETRDAGSKVQGDSLAPPRGFDTICFFCVTIY
jgi:hypothetical protein